MKKHLWLAINVLLVVAFALAACAPATPVTVEVTREVPVVQTQSVVVTASPRPARKPRLLSAFPPG